MKKMVSKVLIGIMVVSLALQCAGCGKTPGENNSSEVQGGTTQSQVSNLDSSDASNGSDSQGGSSSAGVSGSSSAQSASSKPKPLDPTKVDMKGRTIRLHIGQVEAESTSQVGVKFSQKIKEINKRYNCNIQYYISYDFDAINASIASGKPSVDIRWFNGFEQFLNAYVSGFVQPLDPLGNIDFNDHKKFAEITDICKINGKHYGVSPMYYCYGEMRIWFSYIMLYNKDMLKKAGITDDLYKVQEKPISYDFIGTISRLNPKHTYDAKWVNPRDGKMTTAAAKFKPNSDGEWKTPAPPSNTEDWVLLINDRVRPNMKNAKIIAASYENGSYPYVTGEAELPEIKGA